MTTQEILKQTTSPTKISILCWTLAKPEGVTVSDLTELMKVERSNISKQISEMKEVGLLEMKTEGRFNYYFLSNDLELIQIDLIKNIVNSFHIIDENKRDFVKY